MRKYVLAVVVALLALATAFWLYAPSTRTSAADPAQDARIITEQWKIEEQRIGWCEKIRDFRLALGIATGSTCPYMKNDYVFGRFQPDGHPAWVEEVYAPTDATYDAMCAVGHWEAQARAVTDADRNRAAEPCEKAAKQ